MVLTIHQHVKTPELRDACLDSVLNGIVIQNIHHGKSESRVLLLGEGLLEIPFTGEIQGFLVEICRKDIVPVSQEVPGGCSADAGRGPWYS